MQIVGNTEDFNKNIIVDLLFTNRSSVEKKYSKLKLNVFNFNS